MSASSMTTSPTSCSSCAAMTAVTAAASEATRGRWMRPSGSGSGAVMPLMEAGNGRGGRRISSAAPSGPVSSRWRSGVLDGRDVELELDLLADEHAAGLERGVPGQAPVLAVDGGRALEADAQVAEGVTGRAGGLELDGDRLGDALHGQVAGDQPGGGVLALDLGRDEGDLLVVVGVEEVGGLQVAVAVGDTGVDAGGLDGQRDLRGSRVRGVDVRGAGEVGELAADGGDHRVAGAEAEARVGLVDGVVTGDVLDGARGRVEGRVDDGGGGLGAVEEVHGLLLTVGLFNLQPSKPDQGPFHSRSELVWTTFYRKADSPVSAWPMTSW